ncbi:transposase [Termitidicoccus mucosus]|uniref:transposase n=1 Tax=Termitidicoccus mucosus TaxID=1184151 RepID=UPI003CCBACBC
MDTQSGPKNGQEGNEAESLATRPSGALGMPEGTEEVELMEDGAKDRLGRMRLTERRKEELVEEYRASGQRVSDFARQTGVNESTLRHWLKERPPGPEEEGEVCGVAGEGGGGGGVCEGPERDAARGSGGQGRGCGEAGGVGEGADGRRELRWDCRKWGCRKA